MNPNPKYVIDGHEFENVESELVGDGNFPPFYIFDTEKQVHLPEKYSTRESAIQGVQNMQNKIRNAFRYWNRHYVQSNYYYSDSVKPPRSACVLSRAKQDIESGKAKSYWFDDSGKVYPACNWTKDKAGLAYIDSDYSRIGLRLVGYVMPECGYRNGYWFDGSQRYGWNADPDGFNLARGVVFQIPGRNRKARFVAGYAFSDWDGFTVDFSDIIESDPDEFDYWTTSPADSDSARQAANRADSMAQKAAESEYEYQTAWQAGREYGDCLDELKQVRQSVLRTIRDMKLNCQIIGKLPESIKNAIRESIQSDLAERESIMAKMAKLKNGDCEPYYFWNGDKQLQSAFNDAAGKAVL